MLLIAAPGLIAAQTTEENFSKRLQERYEAALLDSALVLEQLKPRMFALQKAYGHLEKEVVSLTNEARITSYSHKNQISTFVAVVAEEKRKGRRKLLYGLAIGAVAAIILK